MEHVATLKVSPHALLLYIVTSRHPFTSIHPHYCMLTEATMTNAAPSVAAAIFLTRKFAVDKDIAMDRPKATETIKIESEPRTEQNTQDQSEPSST